MDSYKHILYGDISSKRVCMDRVETVQDIKCNVTHVAKETDEQEEEYGQQGVEFVGEEKGDKSNSNGRPISFAAICLGPRG